MLSSHQNTNPLTFLIKSSEVFDQLISSTLENTPLILDIQSRRNESLLLLTSFASPRYYMSKGSSEILAATLDSMIVPYTITKSGIDRIPSEIISECLKYLPVSDHTSCTLVKRSWYYIAREILWSRLSCRVGRKIAGLHICKIVMHSHCSISTANITLTQVLDDLFITLVAKSLSNVRTLSLDFHHHPNSAQTHYRILQTFVSECKRMTSLSLINFDFGDWVVQPNVTREIKTFLVQIRALHLERCSGNLNLFVDGIEFPNLTTICLRHNIDHNFKLGLKKISEHTPVLRHIVIDQCYDQAISFITGNVLTSVTIVALEYWSNDFIDAITHLPNLQFLSLTFKSVILNLGMRDIVNHIAECKKLTGLHIKIAKQTDLCWDYLCHKIGKNLKDLMICFPDEKGLMSVCGICKRIERLVLCGCDLEVDVAYIRRELPRLAVLEVL